MAVMILYLGMKRRPELAADTVNSYFNLWDCVDKESSY